MRIWYYTDSTGKRRGPFDRDDLVAHFERGAITRETIIESEDGKTKMLLKDFKEVFPDG